MEMIFHEAANIIYGSLGVAVEVADLTPPNLISLTVYPEEPNI